VSALIEAVQPNLEVEELLLSNSSPADEQDHSDKENRLDQVQLNRKLSDNHQFSHPTQKREGEMPCPTSLIAQQKGVADCK
jgi:hypothetical protein